MEAPVEAAGMKEPERATTAPPEPAPPVPVASEQDLVAFTRLPLEERALTLQLRGVLAESALTGRIRYKWPLLRPLVDFVLEQVLTAYDSETRVEVGPPGPDSVSETIERFQKLLSAFSDAPWTFQRLCEILLEPKRQYSRLPKLVLAIEKCLLVTTEQPPAEADQLPPPPLLTALGPVNVNPAPVYTNTHHNGGGSHGSGNGAGPSGAVDDSGTAFTHSLLDLRHHPGQHHHHHLGNHTGTPEHIEEDHWPEGLPEGKGSFKAAGVGVSGGLHGPLRPGAGGGSPGHGSPGASGSGSSGVAPTAAAAGAGPSAPFDAVEFARLSAVGAQLYPHHRDTSGPAAAPAHALLGAVLGAAGASSPGALGARAAGGGEAAVEGAAGGAGTGGSDSDVMMVDNAAASVLGPVAVAEGAGSAAVALQLEQQQEQDGLVGCSAKPQEAAAVPAAGPGSDASADVDVVMDDAVVVAAAPMPAAEVGQGEAARSAGAQGPGEPAASTQPADAAAPAGTGSAVGVAEAAVAASEAAEGPAAVSAPSGTPPPGG